VNLQIITPVIINEPQFPKPVHEKANPRASRAYHLCEGLLTDIGDWSFVHAFLAKVSQQQQAKVAGAAPQLPDAPEPLSLADRIERMGRALTADELAEVLTVSRITIFKLAKAGRIPCFRIGTCVRFDPRAVANWLRKM